jgi:hypothetical protein
LKVATAATITNSATYTSPAAPKAPPSPRASAHRSPSGAAKSWWASRELASPPIRELENRW